MKEFNLFLDNKLTIGQIEPTLFSSFIEHLGRAVYTGIYEPDHPEADEDGYRKDTIALIKELGVTLVRYPGGNFVSGYNWEDGIGPKDQRVPRLDLAWHALEPNTFGTDEFMKWCKKAEVAPIMAVNLGTGTPQSAGELVEYCNTEPIAKYGKIREKNGQKQPYNVKYWCLGNEMDGFWQICHMDAKSYAEKALEAAKMMRWVDPSIKLVACGSSSMYMPSFPEWDKTVLEKLYDKINYISMHQYYKHEKDEPIEYFFASYKEMEEFINLMSSAIADAKASVGSKKQVYISFDEWNVWNPDGTIYQDWAFARHQDEMKYSFKDALVVGGLLNSLINHADIVKIACLAQLVNVIAPILTEVGGKAIRQTIFYPFKYAANNAKGRALKGTLKCDSFNGKRGKAEDISYSASIDENGITLFLINYSKDDYKGEIELLGLDQLQLLEALEMQYELDYKNDFENPDCVIPVKKDNIAVFGNRVNLSLKGYSWNFLKLSLK